MKLKNIQHSIFLLTVTGFIMISSALFALPQSKPNKVIFLDLDDTITRPARNADGSFIVEDDGHIHAA
jgi:hypothetical protein